MEEPYSPCVGDPRFCHFRRPCDFRVRTKKETRRFGSFGLSVINYEERGTSGNAAQKEKKTMDDEETADGKEEGERGRSLGLSRVVPPRRIAMVATGKLAACLKRPLTSVKIYSLPQQNKPLIRDSARVHLYVKRKRNPKPLTSTRKVTLTLSLFVISKFSSLPLHLRRKKICLRFKKV